MTNKTVLFYSQLGISIAGLIFTGSLLIFQENNTKVYLPIFTSLIFAWIPSPLSNENTYLMENIKKLEDKINILELQSLELKEVKIEKEVEKEVEKDKQIKLRM
jgi:hypothetical protein